MTHKKDRINGADLFSAGRRILRGDVSGEEMRASVERLAAIAQRRPQPCDVFLARLGIASIKLVPDWGAERLTARPEPYDGRCPVCDDRGYYMPRGEGHISAERPCRCRELKRIIDRVERVGVPADLHNATIGETDWGLWEGRLHPVTMNLCHEMSQPVRSHEEGARSAILEGPTGAGKSHLAALIALYCAAEGRSARWIHWPALIKATREEFASRRQGAGIDALYDRLIRPFDLVVLDDLGAGRAPEWIGEVWDGIVGRRSSMKRTLIITTNYRREQLEVLAGARAASRLYGHADTITVNAPDQRRQGGQ